MSCIYQRREVAGPSPSLKSKERQDSQRRSIKANIALDKGKQVRKNLIKAIAIGETRTQSISNPLKQRVGEF